MDLTGVGCVNEEGEQMEMLEEEEELEETAQEKKLRLAKVYLEQLRQQGEPMGWAGEGHGLCPLVGD